MKIRTYRFGFWYTIHEEVNMSEINPYKVNNGGMHIKEMDFRKKVFIPDVNDRTNNDPCYLMSSNDVLKLIKAMYADGTEITEQTGSNSYTFFRHGNLSHADSGKEVIAHCLVDGIIKEATIHHGWSDVQLHGKQLLFIK
jgi:hypothetical protein